MKIILATKSPRRKELLSMIVDNFEVITSDVDENINETLTPQELVKKLAYIKAKTVFDKTSDMHERVVIGSDTIVVKNNVIYGKPKDHDDAVNMIKQLKNGKHEVMTGIAIISEKDGKIQEFTDVDVTIVHISDMNEEEIEKWISSGEVYDKAGAYAIQGKFGVYIDKIEGNYYTVVGLPIHKIYKILKEL